MIFFALYFFFVRFVVAFVFVLYPDLNRPAAPTHTGPPRTAPFLMITVHSRETLRYHHHHIRHTITTHQRGLPPHQKTGSLSSGTETHTTYANYMRVLFLPMQIVPLLLTPRQLCTPFFVVYVCLLPFIYSLFVCLLLYSVTCVSSQFGQECHTMHCPGVPYNSLSGSATQCIIYSTKLSRVGTIFFSFWIYLIIF